MVNDLEIFETYDEDENEYSDFDISVQKLLDIIFKVDSDEEKTARYSNNTHYDSRNTKNENNKYNYNLLFDEITKKHPHFTNLVEYIKGIKPAKRKEWINLIKDTQKGNQEALYRLIDIYLKRILGVVNQVVEENELDFDESFSLGIIGFIKSAFDFELIKLDDLSNNYHPFAYYFPKQMRKYIIYNYPILNNYVSTSDSDLNKMRFVQFLQRKENSKNLPHCRDDIKEFICEKYQLSNEKAEFILNCVDENDVINEDTISDGEENPSMKIMYFNDLKSEINLVLFGLTYREEKVLRLRYGLDDGKYRTLEEVGKYFNVSRERIRQIESKALRKLKHPTRSKRLKHFVENII